MAFVHFEVWIVRIRVRQAKCFTAIDYLFVTHKQETMSHY